MELASLRAKIRDIKNFPTAGILFKDITTLLKDGPAFRYVVDLLAERYQQEKIEIVVGIESRGFIFAGALAHQLRASSESYPGRPSRWNTSSSTAATPWPCTKMPSNRVNACSPSTICWRPAGPWRRRCDSSSRSAARSSGSRS